MFFSVYPGPTRKPKPCVDVAFLPDKLKFLSTYLSTNELSFSLHTHTHTHSELYNRGLVYFDIPIADSDVIVVPPLQGFVMNRVQGDYFETLLYKIFVSIDEHTSISELATVLQVDLQQIKVLLDSSFCC